MVSPDCKTCQSRTSSVFCYLKREELEAFNANKIILSFKKGDIIFREGAYPRGLYCINRGKVKITQTGNEGKEQIVHLAKEGDIMGFRAILGEDIYSCSGIAMENSVICFLPRDTFLKALQNNPRLSLQIFRLFSNMLRETEITVTHIAQKKVRERLATALLLLKEIYGMERDERTINVRITREEIANIAGTTRETAIRVLSELNEEAIIELKGKKIKILNETRLREEACLDH